jgi:hypothetical protein
MTPRSRVYLVRAADLAWFLVCAVASSVWCVTAASQLSATFDEPIYLQRGLEHWRTGSYSGLLRLGTMPLPVDIVTLPLYLAEYWRGVPFDLDNDFTRLLPWARAGTLVFWWLLLVYGWLAGRELAGPWGGRWAVAVLACEPSLLAHAGLATTDLALTACVLALVYHFRTGRDAGWFPRVGLPMFWLAAAVLAKASGIVFGPLCILAVEAERVIRMRATPPVLRTPYSVLRTQYVKFHRDLTWIVGGGLLLVFLYCGSDWKPEPSFVDWAQRQPHGRWVWLAEHLCIFSNAGEGIVRQVKHNLHGHGTYLLGRSHPRALWYYFPVVLTIKLSLPVLLAPVLLALARPRALFNWACVAAGALLVFSLTCRVQIGIRMLLPLVALAIVGLTAAAVQAAQSLAPGWRRNWLTASGAGCLAWTVAAAVGVWPHGLSYINPLWGGSDHGYTLVSEANYDWGQGLKDLARWQTGAGLSELDIWYFGSDPAYLKPPLRHVPLHILPIQAPDDVRPYVRGHYLAVSTTLLYGTTMTDAHQRAMAYLRGRRPVARTRTFLIYDFTGE